MTPTQELLLDRAFEIGRLPCNSYAALKETLLSKGVSHHALAAQHLSATSDLTYPDLREMHIGADSLDAQLHAAITRFGLTPLSLKDYVQAPKFRLGEKLFHDPLLSGHEDRSCATCHKAEYATADGAALEVRLSVPSDLLSEVPARNVPDLWNRDHNDVSTMLWDGRLQAMFAADQGGLVLPDALATTDFENLMALQSVRPIFTPAEMLGKPGAFNDLAPEAAVAQRPEDVLAHLVLRLFTEETSGLAVKETYGELFRDSYGLTTADEVRPAHLGNALAHYIEIEFQSRDTPWDHYLAGDMTALTEDQKRGALLFYGIGKCVVCHSGNVFSDFMFHSVGVPDIRDKKDLGRYYATGKPRDRFLFRTPPLRNVTLTAPYFHNGQVNTLAEAIKQHLAPYRFAREYAEGGEHLMESVEVEAISSILTAPNIISGEQVHLILAFLKSLEDRKAGGRND
ncbi:cytochrome-c peroxidase [Paracoccus alkanivorans]|nr:cytochrome c peroxidase [Paracoccus alkanivorans]